MPGLSPAGIPFRAARFALKALQPFRTGRRLIRAWTGHRPECREARPGDMPAVWSLYEKESSPQSAGLQQAVQRAVESDDPDIRIHVAVVGSEIVGTVTRTCDPEQTGQESPDGAHEPGKWRLTGLLVARRHRGAGIGEALVRSVLAALSRDGAASVVVAANHRNRAALGLYRKLGLL